MIEHLQEELARHSELCERILSLAQKENADLRSCDFRPGCYDEHKSALSSELSQSVNSLRRLRALWHALPQESREQHPQIQGRIRANQELAMKFIMLDRENEQAMLRRGLVAPGHLPNAKAQQPHFVSNLYRRNAVGSAVNH